MAANPEKPSVVLTDYARFLAEAAGNAHAFNATMREQSYRDASGRARTRWVPIYLAQVNDIFEQGREHFALGDDDDGDALLYLQDLVNKCLRAIVNYLDQSRDALGIMRAMIARLGACPSCVPGTPAFAEILARPDEARTRLSAYLSEAAFGADEERAYVDTLHWVVEQINSAAVDVCTFTAGFLQQVLGLGLYVFMPCCATLGTVMQAVDDTERLAVDVLADAVAADVARALRGVFATPVAGRRRPAEQDPYDPRRVEVIGCLNYYFAPAGDGHDLGATMSARAFRRLLVACAGRVAQLYVQRIGEISPKIVWSDARVFELTKTAIRLLNYFTRLAGGPAAAGAAIQGALGPFFAAALDLPGRPTRAAPRRA